MESIKDIDIAKLLIWVVPGVFIALFRSFSMRGSFPSFSKDDISTLILGSVIYFFFMSLITGFNPAIQEGQFYTKPWLGFFCVFGLPAGIGAVLGLLEASDAVGHSLRYVGIRLPSPHATAWETVFRELKAGSVLLVTLKDGTNIYGRWLGGRGGSASSTDTATMDLYLSEIGSIDDQGSYVADMPRRGIYVSSSEIRFFEVIVVVAGMEQ